MAMSTNQKTALTFAAVIGIGLYMWDDARVRDQHHARDVAIENVPDWAQATYDRWIPLYLDGIFSSAADQVQIADPLLGTFTVSKTTPYAVTCGDGAVYAKFNDRQILVFAPGVTEAAPKLFVDPNSRAADKITAQVCAATKARLAAIFS